MDAMTFAHTSTLNILDNLFYENGKTISVKERLPHDTEEQTELRTYAFKSKERGGRLCRNVCFKFQRDLIICSSLFPISLSSKYTCPSSVGNQRGVLIIQLHLQPHFPIRSPQI
jgi:hypothetical protein